MRALETLLLACALAAALPAFAARERIESYHSEIAVDVDASIRVTETIRVLAAGAKIKRGIYRDFPTDYRDRHGNRYRVDFTVLGVTRNGNDEPYHTKSTANGVRVYVGREDRLVDPGTHTYSIRYTTTRQLGFFDEHDELYWNVTGNEWEFPIERASATVTLPAAVAPHDMRVEGYTGAYGSDSRDLEARIAGAGVAEFVTTRSLGVHEGLTIVVAWPKGIVQAPTPGERVVWFVSDNAHVLAAGFGLIALIVYYVAAWSAVGRDPERGVLVAHYEPPAGYSPASMRYIAEMGYDKKCFTAAVLNLAVKGFLVIEENDGEYTLARTGKDVDMAPGEKRLADALFAGERIVLDNKNHAVISAALDKHEQALSMDYENKYFVSNRRHFFVGLALSIVVAIMVVVFAPSTADVSTSAFLIFWSTIWWTATGGALYRTWIHWRHGHGFVTRFGSFLRFLFLVPFVLAGLFVLLPMAQLGVTSVAVVVIALLVINLVFYHLLKAPTRLGRTLLDKAEGFKHYIEVAEQSDLDVRYPEGRTPALFERYLPYAVAFGVEQKWAEHFASVIAAAASGTDGYAPAWYHGSHWHPTNLAGFSSALSNSFTGAATAAASPPGSSSGGGGGGFSGGGGGGGGGGGW